MMFRARLSPCTQTRTTCLSFFLLSFFLELLRLLSKSTPYTVPFKRNTLIRFMQIKGCRRKEYYSVHCICPREWVVTLLLPLVTISISVDVDVYVWFACLFLDSR